MKLSKNSDKFFIKEQNFFLQAFVTLMTDYITHLRKRVEHLNEQDQNEEEKEEENENC